jgi:hypothetical protein
MMYRRITLDVVSSPWDRPTTREQRRTSLREIRDLAGSVVTDAEIEGWLDAAEATERAEALRAFVRRRAN